MKKPKDFLVAEITGFPGVYIPLLSDEECKERGIERPRLPPFETWTDQQKEAGRKLGDVLAKMAAKQALRCVVKQLDLVAAEGYDKADFEKEAARRALLLLRAGTWKAESGEVFGLEEAMCWALESMLRDEGPARRKRAKRKRVK